MCTSFGQIKNAHQYSYIRPYTNIDRQIFTFKNCNLHRYQVNTALAFHQLISPISRSGSIIIKSAVNALWFPNHILTRYPSLPELQMDPFSPYVNNPDHRVSGQWLGTPYVMQSCYELIKERCPTRAFKTARILSVRKAHYFTGNCYITLD